jgi:aminopeptidase
MNDPRVEKLAELLVDYCTDIQPEQKVLIQGESPAQPLLLALYKKTLEKGAYPFMLPLLEGQIHTFLKYASDKQINFIHEPYHYFFEKFDARIRIVADTNTHELSNMDPSRMVTFARAYGGLMNTMLERAAKGDMHWVAAIYPTVATAMDANMSLEEYENFVFNACLPDLNDPIGHWKQVSAYQAKLIQWLAGKKTIHVIGKETDLRMRIDGRNFINCDGKENMPDGEIFTSPVEDSMEGHVYYSYPTNYNNRFVSGIRL